MAKGRKPKPTKLIELQGNLERSKWEVDRGAGPIFRALSIVPIAPLFSRDREIDRGGIYLIMRDSIDYFS